ncbi:MAG: NADAR family protein [Cyanobacteria bacterium J06641_5]
MTIYFYKANEPYGYFSNFSPHPIQIDGVVWPTVEHFYQAHKLLGTADAPLMERIRGVTTPEEAAAIGRESCRIVRPDWETAKLEVMWQGLWAKFSTHAEIRERLLATGATELVENSPRDYFWGCGKDGSGSNELGKMLMQVRQKLRDRV